MPDLPRVAIEILWENDATDFRHRFGGPADWLDPVERRWEPGNRAPFRAGRLVGKLAVARLIDAPAADLADICIVPGPTVDCAEPALCRQSHPPVVARTGRSQPEPEVLVSISHTSRLAAALAYVEPADDSHHD